MVRLANCAEFSVFVVSWDGILMETGNTFISMVHLNMPDVNGVGLRECSITEGASSRTKNDVSERQKSAPITSIVGPVAG